MHRLLDLSNFSVVSVNSERSRNRTACHRFWVLAEYPRSALPFFLSAMPSFYPLNSIADFGPRQVGETAWLLYQLQRIGHTVPNSWVMPAEVFRRSLKQLIAREPLYADWPQLLWQTASTTGYPVQHLTKRLRRPLLSLPLQLPWDALLSHVEGRYVRLIPSLYCGSKVTTAAFAQMLETPVCRADASELETALRQVWFSVLSAKSFAFWSRWSHSQAGTTRPLPDCIEVAMLIQEVKPALFSGTLTLRSEQTVLEVVRGQSMAIAESCPDTYRGRWPHAPQFDWQVGYQEQIYALQGTDTTHLSQTCFSVKTITKTASAAMTAEVEQHLWAWGKALQDWSQQPLKMEWCLSAPALLHIVQAYYWPMLPPATLATQLSAQVLSGYAASPGKRHGRALVLRPGAAMPATAQQQIVIAAEVVPEWLPLLKTAVGVISEQGGMTCHAAVLARELGLPAIVGFPQATERFQSGEILQIDGDRGVVQRLHEFTEGAMSPPHRPQVTLEDAAVEVWLNLSQPDAVTAVADLPVAGIGLLRSEWLMMPVLDHQHPHYWIERGQSDALLEKLVAHIRPLLVAFAPRPVRYRTLDIRSSEFAQLVGAPPIEPNPMLGVRGTFSYRHQPDLFQLELRLIKRLQTEGHDNLQLLLPFVRTVEEVKYCRELVQAMGLDRHPNFELWMMAEVPSVLFLLPQYVAAGIQGIAIGTHDLTQLLLGIDRDQALFSAHFDETHPAVQAAISRLIQQATQLQIGCCICGLSPIHHPDFIETLIHQGARSLSVDVAALEVTEQIIQRAMKS